MKKKYATAWLACIAFSIAYAQERLPNEMAGTGVTSGTVRMTDSSWSIVIESQGSDGAITGKMNWRGRYCQLADQPFTGTYRDGALEISAPKTSQYCGPWRIKMKQTKPNELFFESVAGPNTSVTLKPK